MLPRYRCKRCGNEWIPRTEDPITCPKCRSPYWNRDRINNSGDGEDGSNNNIEK